MFACLCGSADGTSLLDAARTGDVQAAIELIQKKPKLAYRAQQWGGQTAWHLAAKEGHTDVIQAMADTIRSLPPQQLQLLSQFGDTADEIIEELAQEEDTKCLTPLHLACIKGHADAVGLLMSYGVNPFTMDSVGRTALHYAASWGHADCINAVLSVHSGPPKPEWRVGWPNDESTRLVDVQNMAGFTPLHYAVWVGRKEAIQALASYDASLKVANLTNDYDWIKVTRVLGLVEALGFLQHQLEVGAGNTPLHLAAFGGDFDVVKLLLAAHVQTLSAGAEVMAAAHGQWGERHADDVRHMRNRRGLMPYHIAVHKNFQHLTELLHPDIPYTFIFSNDDMQVGSVRMYGPARLMVIAAKALQQKLVSELDAVEKAAAAVTPGAAAAAPDGPETLKADSSATSVLVLATGLSPASASGSVECSQQQQQQEDARAAAAEAAAAVAAAAAPEAPAGAMEPAAAQVLPPTGRDLLSPFAARSHKHWSSTSTAVDLVSLASAITTPASSITTVSAVPHPTTAGETISLISGTPEHSLVSAVGAPAGAAAAGEVGLANATGDSSGMEPQAAGQVDAESAFAAHAANGVAGAAAAFAAVPTAAEASLTSQTPSVQARGGLSSSATAPPTFLAGTASYQGEGSSFSGFALAAQQQQEQQASGQVCAAAGGSTDSPALPWPSSPAGGTGSTGGRAVQAAQQQQQQQQYYSSAASDASASAISSSTVPGSTSAVAGTPAGSIIMPESVASSARGGFSGNRVSVPGSPAPSSGTADRYSLQIPEHSGTGGTLGVPYSRSRKGDESVLQWLPGSSSLPLRAAADGSSITNSSSRGGAAGATAAVGGAAAGSAGGVTAGGANRHGNKALGGSAAERHRRHRRVQSTVDSVVEKEKRMGRQPSKSRRATAEGFDQGRSWLRSMDSFKRVSSRKTLDDDVLPPSAIVTTAADDDGSGEIRSPPLRSRGSTTAATPNRLSMTGPPGRNSSIRSAQGHSGTNSLERQLLDADLAVQAAAQQDGSTDQAEAQREGQPSPGASLEDNPLDVMLASRAGRIGEDPDAVRQHLVLMRLASGMQNFQTAATAFHASRAGTEAGLGAAVGAAAGAAGSTGDGGSSGAAAAGTPPLTTAPSLSSMRSSAVCRSMLATQPSLRRLLSSGNSRSHLAAGAASEQSLISAAVAGVVPPAAAAAAAAAAGAGGGEREARLSFNSTPTTTANGELPMIQQLPAAGTSTTSGMITEEDGEDEDELTCEICFDAAAVVQLQRCGHTLCVGCCKEMCKLHHFKPALCPYCRQIICGLELRQ